MALCTTQLELLRIDHADETLLGTSILRRYRVHHQKIVALASSPELKGHRLSRYSPPFHFPSLAACRSFITFALAFGLKLFPSHSFFRHSHLLQHRSACPHDRRWCVSFGFVLPSFSLPGYYSSNISFQIRNMIRSLYTHLHSPFRSDRAISTYFET